MYIWHKVDEVSANNLEENKLTEVNVAGKRVGILLRTGKLHAFAALCPHAGAPMCDGWIDAMGRIVCPLHKYRFDPANGRNTSGEGYKLYTYPCEIRDNSLYIGLITTNL